MPEITRQLKTALADRYVLERELGAGGMATVYLAQDVKHERNQRNRLYDVAPDGRFVMIQRPGTPDVSGDLVIVQNWFEELNQRVGG